jgi:hypothetical protein
MAISMYQLTVPLFIHTLTSLVGILEKSAGFAEAKKLDPSVLPNARLAPDMYALAKQVQTVSDTIKGAVAHLAGVAVPVWEDNEKTLAELIVRIQKTIDYVATFTAAQIDGSETKTIELKYGGGFEMTFTGLNFLQSMILPNMYFHVSTAYNILRHNGVELGKGDLLGKLQ